MKNLENFRKDSIGYKCKFQRQKQYFGQKSFNQQIFPYSDMVIHSTVSLWGELNLHAGHKYKYKCQAQIQIQNTWRNWHATYMTLDEDNFVGMTCTQQVSVQKLLTTRMLRRGKSDLWFIEKRNSILFVFVFVCIWFVGMTCTQQVAKRCWRSWCHGTILIWDSFKYSHFWIVVFYVLKQVQRILQYIYQCSTQIITARPKN